MAITFEVQRQQPKRSYQTSTGSATVRPLDSYAPPYDPTTAGVTVGAVLAMSLTPTATTVTVNPTGENAVTVTGATAREFICIQGHTIVAANYFRVFARRKPGTTGAIVAQTVLFTIDTVELARIDILAAAASADVISGMVEITNPSGDVRFDITSEDIGISLDAVDSDLEIYFEIIGQNS